MDPAHITTAESLATFRIVSQLGIVRGIAIVDGRHARGILGPDADVYTESLGQAFETAQYNMMTKAEKLGANGIVGMRFVAMENESVTIQVVAYGTAVLMKSCG